LQFSRRSLSLLVRLKLTWSTPMQSSSSTRAGQTSSSGARGGCQSRGRTVT
jgi:hypothetical protein